MTIEKDASQSCETFVFMARWILALLMFGRRSIILIEVRPKDVTHRMRKLNKRLLDENVAFASERSGVI